VEPTDLPRFYCTDCESGKTIFLDEEESRHAKVLRLANGNVVHLVNGRGGLFKGEILSVKKKTEIRVGSVLEEHPASMSKFWLAVAPTKNMNRLEWVIEKAVEMGVSRITPIACERSERVHLKVERLLRIAISAMKQSKGLWLPIIDELTPFKLLMESNFEAKWIAHCSVSYPRMPLVQLQEKNNQLVCIGPEGDFSQKEIELALEKGFVGLDLGEQRLRTETAAVAVCVAGILLNQSTTLPSAL
jgi:16S rRNA (uracil1498-N3)-methyltransferase